MMGAEWLLRGNGGCARMTERGMEVAGGLVAPLGFKPSVGLA